MTRHSLLYFFATILFISLLASCNSSNSDTLESETDLGNCAVKSFSLVKNDKVLNALDSVFFSIDLINARIYNADSLPVGTDVSKLLVEIGTASASAIDLSFRIPGTDRDTTISYIDSPTDSINFADGPVKLSIKATDLIQTREYTIQVNVHQTEPDTLCWSSFGMGGLFTSINTPFFPQRQTSVEIPGTENVVSVAENITADAYMPLLLAEMRALSSPNLMGGTALELTTLPQGYDITSLTAISESEVCMIADGKVYTNSSTLLTDEWKDTGVEMNYIYGVVDGKVLGARNEADGWKHVSLPAGSVTELPADFPVSGTSQLITYTSKWSTAPMALIVGGRKADGSLTGDAWAFDGQKWGKLSTSPLPAGEGYALVPYNTPRVNENNWSVSEQSSILAFGARVITDGTPECSKTVYISHDWGITWAKASDYLQLPENLPAFYGAKAFVGTQMLSVDPSLPADEAGWTSVAPRRLPAWCRLVRQAPASRVTQAPDEWECPYIYLFGGSDAYGKQYNSIWRGVIARYTFQPLY